jgi:hypothetical protein
VEFILAHPLFVIIVGAVVTAFFGFIGFIAGQYVFVPKRCKLQVVDCEKKLQQLHNRISSNYDKIDKIYIRRDSVMPRLDDIHKEVIELRALLFKYIKLNGG